MDAFYSSYLINYEVYTIGFKRSWFMQLATKDLKFSKDIICFIEKKKSFKLQLSPYNLCITLQQTYLSLQQLTPASSLWP